MDSTLVDPCLSPRQSMVRTLNGYFIPIEREPRKFGPAMLSEILSMSVLTSYSH